MSFNKLSSAVVLSLMSGGAYAATANTFDYDVYTGILHSDNITLVDQQPISQSVLIPGVNFTWNQQGADLQANAVGNVEYRDYLGSRFKNTTAVQLSSQALWTLSPQRLDLSIQDYAGIEPLDSLASDRPGNRQQTNIFMVGPVFHFRLGKALYGQAELRYINSYAEKTDNFNSNRVQGALRVIRDISPTSQFSMNIDTQKVNLYKDTVDPNYNRYEAYGHYVSKLASLDLSLEGGASRVSYERAGLRSHTSPLFRASATWAVNADNSLAISGRRQYSDAVQDLTLRPGTDPLSNNYGVGTGNTTVNPQVFLEQKAELAYGFHGQRLTVSVAPYYRKLAYIGDTQYNQNARGVNAGFEFRLRPTLSLQAFASRENSRYSAINRLDRLMQASIGIVDQRTPHWSWRAAVTHSYRHSTVTQQSYDETAVYVGVVFKR